MRRVIATLKADLDNGEGFIKWRPLLDGCSPILRADILKDIKGGIDAAYEQALKDMRPANLRGSEH